jgi:hypothetical protein
LVFHSATSGSPYGSLAVVMQNPHSFPSMGIGQPFANAGQAFAQPAQAWGQLLAKPFDLFRV